MKEEQEVERLRSQSEQQRSILKDCLAHIDQSILNCRSQMDEYRQTRSDLVALNERLANLGAEPVAVPGSFSGGESRGSDFGTPPRIACER